MKRLFSLKSEMIGGRRVSVHRVTCAKCGHSETMSTSRGGNPFPPEAVARHFRHKGWEVSDREGSDKCGGCVAKEKETRRKSRLKVVADKAATAAPEDALKLAAEAIEAANTDKEQPMAETRTLGRDERRIIFGTLDRVYIDAEKGYQPGWNDARVCADLGVPVEWVREIREEMFGPEGESAEVRKLIEEAQAARDEALEAVEELKALAIAATAKADAVLARLAAVSTQAEHLTSTLK